MNSQTPVRTWQKKIVEICESKLGRPLRADELGAITSVGGFLALEMIEDTVREAQPGEIEQYLVLIAAT
jgi:hypothetical protein